MILNNAWDDTAIDFQLDLISRFLDVKEHSINHLVKTEGPISTSLRVRLVQIKDLLSGLRGSNEEIKQRATIILQTVSMIVEFFPLQTLLVELDTDMF